MSTSSPGSIPSGIGIPQQTQPKPSVQQVPGIILPAGSDATPPDTSRVIWTTDGTASGAFVANIFGYHQANQDVLLLEANSLGPGDTASVLLQVLDSTGNPAGFLQLREITDGSAVLTLSLLGSTTMIADDSGLSDFLQIGQPEFSTTGIVTVSFPGGTGLSNPTTVFCPGASGGVQGIATPQGLVAGFVTGVPIVQSIGGGAVNIFLATPGAAPAAGSNANVTYLIWGT